MPAPIERVRRPHTGSALSCAIDRLLVREPHELWRAWADGLAAGGGGAHATAENGEEGDALPCPEAEEATEAKFRRLDSEA